MTNSNFMTIGDFIEKAIAFELESADFYGNMLKMELSQSVRDMVSLLETQEISHAKMLREFDVPQTDEMIQFPPELKIAIPKLPEKLDDLSFLIDLAIQRETGTREIYEAAALHTKGYFKEFIMGLANFEREHEENLTSLKNYY